MASLLNPYLTFGGNCREAMEFYQAALGGQLDINTFGEYGAEGADADGVMHARLETPAGYTLMASDAAPGTVFEGASTSITLSISGDDEDTLRGYWEKLSDGGQVTMPLDKQMWGDIFGMFVDRFGIPWMLDIGVPAA